MPASEFSKFKFLFLLLFFLLIGCLPAEHAGPDFHAEIVVLDPEQSPQQTISECHIQSNKHALNNKDDDSKVYSGFQKQEKFGECMNTKGYTWGQ